MNQHWTVRLEDVAEINPRAPKGLEPDAAVAFVPMAAVSEDGRLGEHVTRPYSEVSKGYSYFERGDLLLAKITPCFENGKAALVDNLVEQIGFGSTEFHVLRPGPDLDGRYLFYMLWNERFRTEATKAMTGSAGQKRVPADLLRRTEVRLPPLDEQRRIAAILDKADALRQKRKRAIALLDSLTQSIFLEMFGDPAAAADRRPLVSLTSKIGSGATPRGGEAAYKSAGVPLIRSMNVRDGTFSKEGLAYIDDTQAAALDNVVVRANDVLLNITGASVARVCRAPNDVEGARVNQHVMIIRPKPELDSAYLEALLLYPTVKAQLLRIGEAGATRQAITKAEAEEFAVFVPSAEQQRVFCQRAELVRRGWDRLAESARRADALFASLQQRAFSGQL